jgi:excisionase family DNA binding protein
MDVPCTTIYALSSKLDVLTVLPDDASLPAKWVRDELAELIEQLRRHTDARRTAAVVEHGILDDASLGCYKAAEVAELMRTPTKRVYELASSKRIPHVRTGRQLRFPCAAFHRWLNEQTHGKSA